MGCTEAWQRTLVPEGLVSKRQPPAAESGPVFRNSVCLKAYPDTNRGFCGSHSSYGARAGMCGNAIAVT
jgi:hypothetical protein